MRRTQTRKKLHRPKRQSPTGRDPIYIVPALEMESGPGVEEYYELRKATFDELRKHQIPEDLIKAVEDYQFDARVTWAAEHRKAPAPIVKRRKRSKKELSVRFKRLGRREAELSQAPLTAGEALAQVLRFKLISLRGASSAPVRLGGMLAQSIIAAVAVDLLNIHYLYGHPPGTELVKLLEELLETNKPKHGAPRQFTARYEAAWVLAQDNRFPTRELARTLGVNASTISRLRRDPKFQKEIQENRNRIDNLRSRGSWPPAEDWRLEVRAALATGGSRDKRTKPTPGDQNPSLAQIEEAIRRAQADTRHLLVHKPAYTSDSDET